MEKVYTQESYCVLRIAYSRYAFALWRERGVWLKDRRTAYCVLRIRGALALWILATNNRFDALTAGRERERCVAHLLERSWNIRITNVLVLLKKVVCSVFCMFCQI